ncbi:PfkB family carbohydrate kinase [Cryobacterium sp.]|uniref:PfkB family carbohydrate kinase n=1 Tax=Cryobacterium sp. TaxID=1926290 RepID=UPI00262A2542|nr:PfkB family carbohydrate kinase [Cryobacterium sp.]MCU1445030.1 hypothetical protein [Cryobacterium sp.]
MIVAGGTYREHVATGEHSEDLGGSGFRAAATLPTPDTILVTAVEPELSGLLSSAATTLQFEVVNAGRDKGVGFTYFAPFVEPVVHGSNARLSAAQMVAGADILSFGIIEGGERSFDAESFVYDPQTTNDPRLGSVIDLAPRRLALCANVLETMAIGGGTSIEQAALSAADVLGAAFAVTKAGARGCLVTDASTREQHWVGAVPTDTVRKLGSGDVFSAAFAHAWFNGATAMEAARVASHGTAWWCGSPADRIPAAILAGTSFEVPGGATELGNNGHRPRVYLAGPFFTSAERWLIDQCLSFLSQAGADVFSPVHAVGFGGPEVASKDLEGLRASDVVFAILDGWDPGTLFETGWAVNAGIPIVAVGANLNHVGTTMLAGTGAELHSDITTALYRAIWVGLGAPIRSWNG